uniref:Uncharacterized protein n=1 Tax=Oryza brachyantha TaxID=4533 RepID=J3N2K7_ORYBR
MAFLELIRLRISSSGTSTSSSSSSPPSSNRFFLQKARHSPNMVESSSMSFLTGDGFPLLSVADRSLLLELISSLVGRFPCSLFTDVDFLIVGVVTMVGAPLLILVSSVSWCCAICAFWSSLSGWQSSVKSCLEWLLLRLNSGSSSSSEGFNCSKTEKRHTSQPVSSKKTLAVFIFACK